MKFTIIPINRKSFGSTLHYPWPLTSESMTEPVLSLLASPQALPPALSGCVGTNRTPVGVARQIAADDDVAAIGLWLAEYHDPSHTFQIGSASCRERVCQYV